MTTENNTVYSIEDEIQLFKSDVINIFSDTKKIEPYLKQVADAVYVPDSSVNLSTDKGRKAVASRAHKVSKIKTQLVKIGKDSVSDLKAQVSKVNQGIKFVEENLNSLRDSTKAPLTAWLEEQERIEKERVEKIKSRIQGIYEMAALLGNETIEEVSSLLEAISNIDCSDGFEEFTADALKAVSETKQSLTSHIQSLISQEQQEQLNKQLEEEKRQSSITENINELKMIPLSMMGKPSSVIKAKAEEVKNMALDEDLYQERYGEAVNARTVAINTLEEMYEQKLTLEESQPSQVESANTEAHECVQTEWARNTKPVVSADEILSEHSAPTTDELHDIASHIQGYCGLTVEQAMLVAECLISTNVPFITFNRKAA